MYIFKITLKTIIISSTISLLLVASNAQAAMKKWVDENGQVHYGDRVPSKYLKKEHSTLSEQGVTIRTSKTLKTEKELSDEEEARAKKAAEDKINLIAARKKALRDRVLLDTFTTENDLVIARDARTESIDSQISLAETLIKSDEAKLKVVKQRISEIEASGRKAPENLHKEVVSVSRALENHYAYVEDKTNERVDLLKTFDEDVKRFRELHKEKQKVREKLKQQQQLRK